MSSSTAASARALVVGAGGQVGTQLMLQLGPAALGAGRHPGPPAHLASDWLQIDLQALARDSASVAAAMRSHPLSAIYCVAGATDVDRCESDPDWAFAVNAHGPGALAAASPRDAPFVYFSTEYIFDGVSGPYPEESPTRPLSHYGRSKLAGERQVLAARPDALIVRTTVVYGDDPAAKNFLYFLHRQLSCGQRTRIVSDQISTPTSNDDLAAAAIELVRRRHSGIIHICGPDLLSRYDFALRAADLLALDASLIHPVSTVELKQRAPRPLAAGLRTERLQSLLGTSAMKGVDAGITAWQAKALHRNNLP